jgi:hypothetical protein
MKVRIITQDRYDTIHTLSRSDFGTGIQIEPSEKFEKMIKEMQFTVSMQEAAAMKPTDDDPIEAIVLTRARRPLGATYN